MDDLKTIIEKAIKKEITEDPEGRGYVGKTDAEVADLLNISYLVPVTSFQEKPSRINQILLGVANTPNIVDETIVNNAKKQN